MVVALSEPVKFRVEPTMKDRWDKLLAKKKITQQDAGVALVERLLEWDDLLQSMVLGQVNPDEDLAGIVARRLAAKPQRRRVILVDPGAKPSVPPQSTEKRPGEHTGKKS